MPFTTSFLFLGISGGELVVVLLLVLVLFGANRLPEMARSFGKGLREVRNAADQIKHEISDSSEDDTLKKFKEKVDKEKKEIEDLTGSVRRKL